MSVARSENVSCAFMYQLLSSHADDFLKGTCVFFLLRFVCMSGRHIYIYQMAAVNSLVPGTAGNNTTSLTVNIRYT